MDKQFYTFEVAFKSNTSAYPVYCEVYETLETIKEMVSNGEIYSTFYCKD